MSEEKLGENLQIVGQLQLFLCTGDCTDMLPKLQTHIYHHYYLQGQTA